jgi:hypothetical protein
MLTRKVSFVIIALVLFFGTLIVSIFEYKTTFAPYFIQNPIESAANNQVIQQHRLINIAKGKNAKQSSTFKSYGAAWLLMVMSTPFHIQKMIRHG